MEFYEKLQKLRKNRELTQEELAEALHVSRTAVSKWESGRGYPNIDSLKEISKYFSVSIDELLSGEKILSIAEEENKSNIQKMRDLFIGTIDICTILLIVLPIYPHTVKESVYSVNLFRYVEIMPYNYIIYWIFYVILILIGTLKILFAKLQIEKLNQGMTCLSIGVSVLGVLFFALMREAYAISFLFIFLVIKGILLYEQCK